MRCERNFFKDVNNIKKYDIIWHNDCLYIIMDITDSMIELYRLSYVNIACCIYENDGTYVVCNLEETLNKVLAVRPIPMLIVQGKWVNNKEYGKLEPNKYRDRIKKWVIKNNLIGLLFIIVDKCKT